MQTLDTLPSSMSSVLRSSFPRSSKFTFSLVFLLLIFLWKTSLLLFTSFVRFNSRWALAFLIHPCMLRQCLHIPPSSPALLLPLVCFIFMFKFSQELLVHPWRPPDTFAWLPAHWLSHSWAWRTWLLKTNQIYQYILFSGTVSHMSLPSRSLNRPKSVLLKSRVAIQQFALLPPLRTLNFTISWW